MNQNCPKFISIEGFDGSGKTTALPFIIKHIEDKGYKVCKTRDPGSTPLGNTLRDILLSTPMSPMTELKLFDTIRQDMLDEIVRPFISKGYVVISDRYVDSLFAYQGYGRGLLKEVEEICQGLFLPDKTILLDISLEESNKRMSSRNAANGISDRFEEEKAEFKKKVHAGYLAQADKNPDRIVKIDASGTVEEVQANLVKWLDSYF